MRLIDIRPGVPMAATTTPAPAPATPSTYGGPPASIALTLALQSAVVLPAR